jgi:transcriptional regulator with XRE-family HTH domain
MTDALLLAFGERLKQRLEGSEPRRTQAWLADESGIDRATVSRIISGERNASAEQIDCMAKVLGVEVGVLVRGTDAEARVDEAKQVVHRGHYEGLVKQVAEYESRLNDADARRQDAFAELEREKERRRVTERRLGEAYLAVDRSQSDLAEVREQNRRLQLEIKQHREAIEQLALELAAVTSSTQLTKILAGIAAATGVATLAAVLWPKDGTTGGGEAVGNEDGRGDR